MLIASLVTACTGATEADDGGANPYVDDLKLARERATSPLEKAILEDLEIDRAEYEEAVAAYVACVNGRGGSVTTIDQAGYFVYQSSGDTNQSQLDDCRVGTVELIEQIYVDQLTNPDRRDWQEAIHSCFRRLGLTDESYSLERFEADMATGFDDAPFALEDPSFDACMANPAS